MKSVYKLPLQTAMEYTERVNDSDGWNSLVQRTDFNDLSLQTAMEYAERVNNWIVWNSLINLKIEK